MDLANTDLSLVGDHACIMDELDIEMHSTLPLFVKREMKAAADTQDVVGALLVHKFHCDDHFPPDGILPAVHLEDIFWKTYFGPEPEALSNAIWSALTPYRFQQAQTALPVSPRNPASLYPPNIQSPGPSRPRLPIYPDEPDPPLYSRYPQDATEYSEMPPTYDQLLDGQIMDYRSSYIVPNNAYFTQRPRPLSRRDGVINLRQQREGQPADSLEPTFGWPVSPDPSPLGLHWPPVHSAQPTTPLSPEMPQSPKSPTSDIHKPYLRRTSYQRELDGRREQMTKQGPKELTQTFERDEWLARNLQKVEEDRVVEGQRTQIEADEWLARSLQMEEDVKAAKRSERIEKEPKIVTR
jgi:hypothetical protein